MGPMRERVVVPQECVEQRQGDSSLWVIGADSVAEYRKVRLGQTVGEKWAIEEGLTAGEWVVCGGVQKLRNGVKVSPRKRD